MVTGGGASALRISPGLTVGESAAGALTLNDPETPHQWIELVISDSGDPWVTIVTRDKSLRVDGASHMRYRLAEGTALQLPNNTLHVSREIRMPRPSGVVIEVVPRDVPGRAQDLMGPEWAEAIAAFQEPPPASSLEDELEPAEAPEFTEPSAAARAAEAEPEPWADAAPEPDALDDPDRTRIYEPPPKRGRPAEAPTELDRRSLNDLGVAIAEPRPGRPYRRRPRRRGRATAVLASLAVIVLAAGGVAAVLFTLSNPLGRGSDPEPGFVDAPLYRVPDGPGRESSDPSAPDPAAPAAEVGTASQVPTELPGGTPGAAGAPADAAGAARADSQVAAAPADQPVSPSADPGAGAEPTAPQASASPPERVAPDDAQLRGGAALDSAPSPPPQEQVALLPQREPPPAAADEPAPGPSGESVQEPAPAPEPSRATVTRESALPDWRLVRARELLDAGYITFPPKDNAVDYVERLLAEEPGNRQALAMLQLCSDRLIEAAMRAHDQGMDYEARNTLEEVLGFDPRNERANRLWREWVGSR